MGRGKGHTPIRTCISCGAKGMKNELIRFVLDERGSLRQDKAGGLQGRGLYICKNETCFLKMSDPKTLQRVFKGDKAVRISPLLDLNETMKD